MAVCYTKIFLELKSSSRRLTSYSDDNEKRKEAFRSREYRLATTAALAVFCFVISWTPYACIGILSSIEMVGKYFLRSLYKLQVLIYVIRLKYIQTLTLKNKTIFLVRASDYVLVFLVNLLYRMNKNKYVYSLKKYNLIKNLTSFVVVML